MTPEIRPFTVNGHPFHMIRIPAGEFRMGDDESEYKWEKPTHRVRLDGFYLGQFPVTQALWKAVMEGDNPSFFAGDERPVEQVSWERITQEFLPALKELTGWVFRLPTEAEWEYAARGGPHWEDGFQYAGSDKLKEVGWYHDNSHHETKPVGLKYPNPLGLYDMSGNVWEWCHDWFDDKYYKKCAKQRPAINPQGPEKGVRRVVRGGSFWGASQFCRGAYRSSNHPADAHRRIGFRLAASFQAADLTTPAPDSSG